MTQPEDLAHEIVARWPLNMHKCALAAIEARDKEWRELIEEYDRRWKREQHFTPGQAFAQIIKETNP